MFVKAPGPCLVLGCIAKCPVLMLGIQTLVSCCLMANKVDQRSAAFRASGATREVPGTPMRSAQRHLCLLLLVVPLFATAADVPIPEPAREAWDKIIDAVWLKAKPRVAFCLGEGEAGVLKTMVESFPNPLPTEPADDPICSNATRLGEHLCGPKSLMEYYKVGQRKRAVSF